MSAEASKVRKETPLFSGVMRYFPRTLQAVARVSFKGNQKHNPGEPLHWSRGKSKDHADCVARHLLTFDQVDEETGELHGVHGVWRFLALMEEYFIQREEAAQTTEAQNVAAAANRGAVAEAYRAAQKAQKTMSRRVHVRRARDGKWASEKGSDGIREWVSHQINAHAFVAQDVLSEFDPAHFSIYPTLVGSGSLPWDTLQRCTTPLPDTWDVE